MFAFLKRFFTDETAFIGMIRAGVMGAGAVVATGQGPEILDAYPTAGVALMALSSAIRAGDKNAK